MRATALLPFVLAGGVGLVAPLPLPRDVAWQSPSVAAERAERELPSLGLGWGRLRGWHRTASGWSLVWQPAHGAWLVRGWVPDAAGPVRWRLEAASWLPGVRLSTRAAEWMAATSGPAMPRERVGRRDWRIGERSLLGALPAGGELPERPPRAPIAWRIGLIAALLAGALARAVFPGVVARGWRQTALWSALGLVFLLPFATPLALGLFRVGVRPWITELAWLAAGFLALGAVAVAAMRFPAKAGRAAPATLAAALGIGVLAGRLQPAPWLVDLAGLPTRLPLWVGLALLGGWLAGMAGEGVREMLEPARRLRPLLLGGLAVLALLSAGPLLAVVAAVLLAGWAARGEGSWVAVAAVWGLLAGAALGSCAWLGATRDGLVMLLGGCLLGAVASRT